MIEMFVTGIALDVRNNHPLVILNDATKKRALPIWIGHAEAQAIARALEGFKPERPLTHDLMIQIVEKTGYKVHHIEINDLNENTYFASIVLERGVKTTRISADDSSLTSASRGTFLAFIRSAIFSIKRDF